MLHSARRITRFEQHNTDNDLQNHRTDVHVMLKLFFQ